MTALIVLGIVLGSIAAYGLIGYAFYHVVRTVRGFDYVRGDRSRAAFRFEHGSNQANDAETAFMAGLLWPFIGVISVAYHLSKVGWNAEQRLLVKELVEVKPEKTTLDLRRALDAQRQERMEQMQKEIDRLQRESEIT